MRISSNLLSPFQFTDMKHLLFCVFVGTMLFALPLQGQNHTTCATPTPKDAPIFTMQQQAESQSAGPYVVQIFVHILRNTDGTNAAMTDAQLQQNLDRMAAFFRPHDICFTFLGRDFIDNTDWNMNYTTAEIGNLHAVNPHSDAIDIYVHRVGFEGSGGNAYSIPSDKCSVAATATFNFEHEVGHCLGLLHTFETAFGTECPDGSNCGPAGDRVCDTPADFSGSENFFNGCTFNGTQTIDCNGGTFGYNPPTINIMSYWAGCYAEFSAGQGTRMRNTINGTQFLLDRLTPVDQIITGVTLTDEIAVGAQNSIRIGNIAALGDVLMNANAHGIFNAGSFIRAEPGTRIVPTGNNGVLLTINPHCEGLLFTSTIPVVDRETPPAPVFTTDNLVAYPNPFTNKINVRVQLSKPGPASLQLFDFSGRLVQSIDCQSLMETSSLEDDIELPTLQAGIFFLRLQHAGGIRTQKLIRLGDWFD